jgi:hypothetical protein
MQTRTAAEQVRYTRLHRELGQSKGEERTSEVASRTNCSRALTALSLGLTALVLCVAAAGAAGAFNGRRPLRHFPPGDAKVAPRSKRQVARDLLGIHACGRRQSLGYAGRIGDWPSGH